MREHAEPTSIILHDADFECISSSMPMTHFIAVLSYPFRKRGREEQYLHVWADFADEAEHAKRHVFEAIRHKHLISLIEHQHLQHEHLSRSCRRTRAELHQVARVMECNCG